MQNRKIEMLVKVMHHDTINQLIRKIMTTSIGDSRFDLQILIRSHANYLNMYASNLTQKDTDLEDTYKQVTVKTNNFIKKLEDYGKRN